MAENWYIILELEFDPPVEDEAVIAAKIDERARFWSTHFNDFKNGPQYRNWHQKISTIKKDMIGPENRRKQLAEEACTIVYGPVDKQLRMLGLKGSITEDAATKMAKRSKLSVDAIKRRAQALGIKWEASGGAGAKNYQTIYDKYVKARPPKADVFDGFKKMLESFQVDNLYDFLRQGETVADISDLPCKNLRELAEQKKQKKFYKNDSISGTGSKLCSQCINIFSNETSKAEYDNYLIWVRRVSVLREAKGLFEISGKITAEQGEAFIVQLIEVVRDQKLATDIFQAFCEIEGILYLRAEDTAQKSQNIIVCRCGCINDVSDGRTKCQKCGRDLNIRCPKCGTMNKANINVCKCGFPFANLDRALALCAQASALKNALRFEEAKAFLKDAGAYWPGCPKIREVQGEIDQLEKRAGPEGAALHSAMKDKRYCEAQRKYAEIQRLFPGYADTGVETEINEALARTKNLVERAKASKDPQEVLELCTQANDLCADYPGIRELIPAPAAVTGFKVEVNPVTRANTISWNGSGDKTLRYLVVRSTNGWISRISDGEVVWRGSASVCVDKDIEPGVTYYYNTFAERAGVCSSGAKGDMREAINLFEISRVTAAAGDASINISWGKLPKNATAEICEVPAVGPERPVQTSTQSSCLIQGLKNGTSYRYHVFLTYMVGGKKVATKGVTVNGTPDSLPMPVEILRVRPKQDGNFEAIWVQEKDQSVKVYGSETRPQFALGDVLSVEALEQAMQPVQTRPLSAAANQSLKPDEDGVSFHYDGKETLYVSAIVIKGSTAVFGAVARANTGEALKVRGANPANGRINIYLDPPPKVSGFVVLYRFDKFPEDIEDREAVRKRIPLKQYQLNSAIVLDSLEPRKYYFSIFAEYKENGELDYSAGTDYLFDNGAKVNITYSISVSKKFLGGGSVIFEFEAESHEFDLPDIDIMSAVGHAPMFKASATMFHQLPAQHVVGTLVVKIPIAGKLGKDTYVKAFFRDEAATAGSQLRLKLKSNYKIS